VPAVIPRNLDNIKGKRQQDEMSAKKTHVQKKN
jgi:hypothetical protein